MMFFFFPPPMKKYERRKIYEKRDRSGEFGIGAPVAMDWRLAHKWVCRSEYRYWYCFLLSFFLRRERKKKGTATVELGIIV